MILQLCVDKKWRNRNIGTRLMLAAEKMAKKKFKHIISASNIKNYPVIMV